MSFYRRASFLIINIFVLIAASLVVMSQPTLLVPLNTQDCVRKDTVVFDWTDVAGAIDYQITISPNADLSAPVVQTNTNQVSTFTASLPASGQQYYWRATAILSGLPPTQQNSIIWSLTTLKAPPTQLQPSNGNSCVSKTTTFKWQKFAVTANYTFQLSTVANFSSFVVNQTIQNDSMVVTLPNYNTTYYWRVYAAYGTCTTDLSPTFSFTTQNQAPTIDAPINGLSSVSVSGMRFNWSATIAPTSYTFQESTDSTFAIVEYEAIKTATTDTLSNFIFNKTYFCRIMADYAGCKTPWSPITRFRTQYDKPINLVPKTDTFCIPISMRFKWDAVSGATKYRLQLSEFSDFSKLTLDSQNIDINYLNYNLPKGNQRYYWRVKAADVLNTGDWSDVNVLNSAVFYATKLLPANNNSTLPVSITFKWTKPDPSSYERIQVSDDITFGKILFDVKNINKDTLVLKMPNFFKKFYWRVSSNLGTCFSSWSDIWSFSTVLLPPKPIYPANNATGLSQNITFEWSASEGGTTYEFNLATDLAFTNIFWGSQGIPGTKVYVPNLDNSVTYYWRTRVTNSEGTSVWSQTYKFRTGIKLLETPFLVAPLNGSEKNPVTKVTAKWDTVPAAKKYIFQLDVTQNFIKPIINVSDVLVPSFDITSLNYNTIYYWRVKAVNDTTASDWSPIWSFSTLLQIPTDPAVLTKPTNNANGVAIDQTLEWDKVARAENYDLQIATDDVFSQANMFLIDTIVINNNRYVSNLKNLETYYWKVRGKNYSGYGPWSETFKFTTIFTSVPDVMPASIVELTPNPVNGVSTLTVNLENDAHVKIEVVNIAGTKLSLLNDKVLPGGGNQFTIKADSYSNGIYFCNIEINGQTITKKFVVSK